jgi:glucokinase
MSHAIGIDLGGTNLKMLAIAPEGKVLAQRLAPHVARGRGWMQNVRRTFDQLNGMLPHPPQWIGVAAPGLPARDHQSIAHMPDRLPGLEGMVWRRFLRVKHGVPVVNDAKAALMGEVWRGAARGAQNALLITLGTGVGGAAMVDGRVLHGHIGRAGHFGHMSLDPEGTPDIVNTPGSLEAAIGDCTVKTRTAGQFESTKELLRACSRGDAHARRAWLKSVRALAAAIASLVNVLDPQVVVIGGGIAKAGAALFNPLNNYLTEFEWRPAGHKARIVPAKLGDRAGAFGAAWNAMQRFPANISERQGLGVLHGWLMKVKSRALAD